MILSIHVPKTAGNSLRESLAATYGDRMMRDYGDWAGCDVPEANERRASRTVAMRARAAELQSKYDVIHGHFIADKYLGLFPSAEFVAFFRDPYQQAVAHYHFLVRNPERDHIEERILHERKMSLHDYLEWDAFHNQQSQYLGSLSIDDFTMVGLSSEFTQSLAMFGAIFGANLGEERFANVNEDRTGAYPISRDVKKLVETYRAADIELYRRAVEIFRRQSRLLAA
jgi:hypothetical protein